MAQTATFENVWKMFQESDRKFQEMIREDRERREEERKQREGADRKRSEEIALQMKATDIKIKEVAALIDSLGGSWGRFVDGLVVPACKTLFAQRGIPIHTTGRNVEAKWSDGRRLELDIFMVSPDIIVLVQVARTLNVECVREHLARLADGKECFP